VAENDSAPRSHKKSVRSILHYMKDK